VQQGFNGSIQTKMLRSLVMKHADGQSSSLYCTTVKSQCKAEM